MDEEEDFNCILCSEIFDNKQTLQEHFRQHGDPNKHYNMTKAKAAPVEGQSSEEKIKCDVCPEEFLTIAKAITHKHKAHPDFEAKYYCGWCGKVFTMKNLYDKHLKLHEDAKETGKYPCDICQTEFYVISAVRYHNKFTHKDEETNNTGVSKKQKLVAETLVECSFCPFCGEEYINRINLLKHIKDDHNDEEQSPVNVLRCPLCEAVFYHLDSYDLHLTFHSPDDIYITEENAEKMDLVEFTLDTVPPISETVDANATKESDNLNSSMGIEQFLELAMDTDNDNITSTQEKPKHKKHKKHKKNKKSAITLDEFLNMNQDVFGEGLDFQGVEEVPTQAVAKLKKRKQTNSAKIVNPGNAVMSPSNLDKLKRQGIVVKRTNNPVRNNPTATRKPIKISDGVSKAMINEINKSVKTESADSLLNKLRSKPNSQLKIVKKSENLSECKSLDKSNPDVGMKTLALPKDDITTQPDEKVDGEYSDEDNHEIDNNSKIMRTQRNCDNEGKDTKMEATIDYVQTSKQNVLEIKTSSEGVDDNSEMKQNKLSSLDQFSKDKLLTNAQLTIKPIKRKLNSDLTMRTGASVTVRTGDCDAVDNDSNYSDNDEHIMSTKETTETVSKNKLMHNSQLTVKSSNVPKLIPKINENLTENKLADKQQTDNDNIKEDKSSEAKSCIANRLLGNLQLTIKSSTPKPNQGIQRPIKSNEGSQMFADKDASGDEDLINDTISRDTIYQTPQNKSKAKTVVQSVINKTLESEDITTIIDDSDSDDFENNFGSNLEQNANVDKIKLQLSKQNQSKITKSNNSVINKCNVVSKSMNVLKNIKGITVKSQCKTIEQLQTAITKEDFPNDGGGFESFSDGDNDDCTENNIATHLKVNKANFNINTKTKSCINTVQSVKQCNINRSTFGKDTEETLIVRSNKTQTAFVNKLTNANSGLSIKPIKSNVDIDDMECDDSENNIKLERLQDVVGKLNNINSGLSIKSLQNRSQLNECDNEYEDATSNKSNVLGKHENSEQAAIVNRLKTSLGLSIKGLQNKSKLESTISGSGDNDSDNDEAYECDVSQNNMDMDNCGKKNQPIVNELKNTNIGVSLKPLANTSQNQRINMSCENDSDDLDDCEAFVNSLKHIGQKLKTTAVGLSIKAKGTNKNDFDISPEREVKQLKSNSNVLHNLKNTYKGLHVKSSKYNIQEHCSDAVFDDDGNNDQRLLDDDVISTKNQLINREAIMNKLKNSSLAISVKPSTNRILQRVDDHESADECIQDVVNNKLKTAEARMLKNSVNSNVIDENFESDSDFDDHFDETEQYEKSKQDVLLNKLKNTNVGLSIKPMKSHSDSSSPNNSNKAEAQVSPDNEFKKVSPVAPEKSLKRDVNAVFGNKSVAIKQPKLQRPTIDDMQQVANTSRSCINKSNRIQTENKTVSNTNQGEVVSKEVSLKTVQNQTVIEEVTTTVTRTIRTINQQSVNENISTSLNRPIPGPQRIVHKPMQSMKIKVPTMQVKPSINQNLPMRPQIPRPSTQMKPTNSLIKPTQRMAQFNQPTFGKPLRIAPNVLKPPSTIKQTPGNVRVQGCVKKSEETNLSAMKSVSINKNSQVVRNSSTIAKKECSSTVTSKFCSSSSVQQFRTASSVNVANSGMPTQKGTPNLIQKLQQQGLLIKKPRLDIDFSDETDSNDGFPDSEDYTVNNEH